MRHFDYDVIHAPRHATNTPIYILHPHLHLPLASSSASPSDQPGAFGHAEICREAIPGRGDSLRAFFALLSFAVSLYNIITRLGCPRHSAGLRKTHRT
jgi:hypothetical protein